MFIDILNEDITGMYMVVGGIHCTIAEDLGYFYWRQFDNWVSGQTV